MDRNTSLDGLRGIAIISVVLYHYTKRFDEIYYPLFNINLFKNGGEFGVGLFFILSGYLMIMIGNRYEFKHFILKRFFRLYPAYIISVALTSLIITFFGPEYLKPSLSQILVNFTMFQEFFGIEPVDGVYWTLTLELLLYFFISILLLIKKIEQINIFILIWILIQFIAFFLLKGHIPHKLNTLFFYSNYFLIGFSLYNITKKKNILPYLITATVLFTNHYLYYANTILLILIILVFTFALYKKNSILSSNFLVYLGTISYSLYLIHQYIGYVLIDYFFRIFNSKILSLVFTTTIILSLAYLISKYIEQPMIKFGHKLLKKI